MQEQPGCAAALSLNTPACRGHVCIYVDTHVLKWCATVHNQSCTPFSRAEPHGTGSSLHVYCHLVCPIYVWTMWVQWVQARPGCAAALSLINDVALSRCTEDHGLSLSSMRVVHSRLKAAAPVEADSSLPNLVYAASAVRDDCCWTLKRGSA